MRKGRDEGLEVARDETGEVGSFRVRGFYPNLRRIAGSLSDAPQRDRSKGGMFDRIRSVLTCELSGERGVQSAECALHDADLLMLQQSDEATALRHASLILRARSGDEQSLEELKRALRRRFRGLKERIERFERLDDSYLVLSTSHKTYPVNKVSHKGAMLLRLHQEGYPVPDFAVLTADAYPDGARKLEEHVGRALEALKAMVGCEGGDQPAPLVIAIRCAMPQYYPGLMPTYLNVGITESMLPDLERLSGKRVALEMYLNNLKNILVALGERQPQVRRATAGKKPRGDLDKRLTQRIDEASDMVRKRDTRLLEDAFHQTTFLAREAYHDFETNADLLASLSRGVTHHPALIMQKMVCSVGEGSYVGVLHSRNPDTGSGSRLNTAVGIFGEDIMTGAVETMRTDFDDPAEIRESFPSVSAFVPFLGELEGEFQFPVTLEFAAEARAHTELFALLQLNQSGMAGRAAFIAAVDLLKAGVISRKQVAALIQPYHVKQVESDTIEQRSFEELSRFCHGVSVLPRSAICARIYFTAETALKAKRRGDNVCFCKRTFRPTDTVVMQEVDAILSLTSAAIHVVTLCQSFGIPALLNLARDGVTLTPQGCLLNSAGVKIHEGEFVTISSRRQVLFRGKARFQPARFMRFLKNEKLDLDPRDRKAFEELAYAYRYYLRVMRALSEEQTTTLQELTRLVNLEIRGKDKQARDFVRSWFDAQEHSYVEEVFRSQLGDHLNQHRIFELLTQEQKTRFFVEALERCDREGISGYEAGAFMLGRFSSTALPLAVWRGLDPRKTALLLNEWLLFEKYTHVLSTVGEREIRRARKRILMNGGLGKIPLSPSVTKELLPLKLSRTNLEEVRRRVPKWRDSQLLELLRILERPYKAFFDFEEPWSLSQLETMCRELGVEVPSPDDR